MDKTQVPQAVQACHELLLWLIPLLDQFPRSRRFTLGERLESGFLKVLELLVAASYSREKLAMLVDANRQLAVCRHLWRLCYELKVIPSRRYEHGAKLIDGIGGQIGLFSRRFGKTKFLTGQSIEKGDAGSDALQGGSLLPDGHFVLLTLCVGMHTQVNREHISA